MNEAAGSSERELNLDDQLYRTFIGPSADTHFDQARNRSGYCKSAYLLGGFYYLYHGIFREGTALIAALILMIAVWVTLLQFIATSLALKASVTLLFAFFASMLGKKQCSLFYPAYDDLLRKRVAAFKQVHSYAGSERMLYLAQQQRTTYPIAAALGVGVLLLAFGGIFASQGLLQPNSP